MKKGECKKRNEKQSATRGRFGGAVTGVSTGRCSRTTNRFLPSSFKKKKGGEKRERKKTRHGELP